MANRRECVDAPTVGSSQESVYQQQVHTSDTQNVNKVSENAYSVMHADDEEHAKGIEMKDLGIYDSLEVDAHPCSKQRPTHAHTDSNQNISGMEGRR